MTVVKETIQTQINSLIDNTKDLEQKESQAAFASGLADIVKNAILSATVTVQAGIPVATSGGAGATSAPGTGSLS